MSLPVSTITKPALPKVKVKKCYINRLAIWDSISNRRILSMIRQPYTMPQWRWTNLTSSIFWLSLKREWPKRSVTNSSHKAWKNPPSQRMSSASVFLPKPMCAERLGKKLILPLRLCWTLPILKSIPCINRKMWVKPCWPCYKLVPTVYPLLTVKVKLLGFWGKPNYWAF